MPETTPKILFAIVTCFRKTYAPEATHSTHKSGINSNVQWVQDTWFADTLGVVDAKFFFGGATSVASIWEPGGITLPPQESHDGRGVVLPVGDDYYSLVPKVRAVIRWAYDHGYDYLYKIDDDVYVDVEKTLAGFLPVDYRGNMREGQVKRFGEEPELTVKYACGPCYILSRKAMEAIINSPEPATPYEDRATGYVLSLAGIPLTESTELMTCLCKHCLAQPGNYAQFHVEEDGWREKFLAQYQK
jgi:hypothetical protein